MADKGESLENSTKNWDSADVTWQFVSDTGSGMSPTVNDRTCTIE